jgi:transcriptional regulator with XRE-family HTH domain
LAQRIPQREVAKALGVTFQQVQKYENGANRIAMGRLHLIANFLSLPMSYFFEGLDANQSAGLRNAEMKAIDVVLKTKEGTRVAAALSRINSVSLRRQIAELLEAIIARDNEEKAFATESQLAPSIVHVGDLDNQNHPRETTSSMALGRLPGG